MGDYIRTWQPIDIREVEKDDAIKKIGAIVNYIYFYNSDARKTLDEYKDNI